MNGAAGSKALAAGHSGDAGIVTEADALHLQATLRPEHVAIHFKGRRLTYGELDRRACRVAAGIARLGIAPGGRVGVLTKNSDEYFELLFGLIRAGSVPVPLNWRLSLPEVAVILNDAGATTLFIQRSFADMVDPLRKAVPTLRNVLILGDDAAEGQFTAWRDEQPDSGVSRPLRAAPDDVMLQFYTSGTTGRPKGVQVTHRASRQMRRLEVADREAFAAWGPGEVAIVALPNSHLSGTSWALQWFARGATCVIQEQVDAGEFIKAIEEFRVTQLVAVPTVLDLMIEHPLRPRTDLTSLKTIYYGSAPISPMLLEKSLRTFNCELVQLYGMTETNGVLCYLSPEDHDLRRPHLLRSCGKPYPMVDLKIMGPEGQQLPPRQIGEICVKTPCLMKGYWSNGKTLQGPMHGEYFRTGDGGFKDEEGFVYLVDRIKDMIVSGGENIYPAEIENVARELTDVKDIAVIGVPSERWGEAVMAVVVRRSDDLTERRLLDFVRTRIAGYKVPKSVVFVQSLPHNASGKVLKRQLREQFTPQQ